jgi:hypothetical protein
MFLHKTDIGAVALGLRDGAALGWAAKDMRRRLEAQQLWERVDGFLVEEMIEDGVAELVLALRFDPRFGWVITVGSGGALIELMDDAQIALAPVSADEIARMIARSRAGALLRGYRGRPPGDEPAFIALALALQRAALDPAAAILEIECNPVIVRPIGRGAIVVDATMRVLGP